MTQNTYQCYNCNANNSLCDNFCTKCNILQPPLKIDHFARFGLTSNFDLNLEQLETIYFSLQKKFHPDLFTQKNEIEKNFAFKHTLLINQAYETLSAPLSRSEYILSLNKIYVNCDHQESIKPKPEL